MSLVQDELGLSNSPAYYRVPNQVGFKTTDDRTSPGTGAIAWVLGSEKKNRHLVPSWKDIDVLKSVNEAVSPL